MATVHERCTFFDVFASDPGEYGARFQGCQRLSSSSAPTSVFEVADQITTRLQQVSLVARTIHRPQVDLLAKSDAPLLQPPLREGGEALFKGMVRDVAIPLRRGRR